MQSNVRKMMQIAAMLFLVLGLANTAWAGGRWKVGDVIVCFGSGTCKVVRPAASPATSPLDTISDSGSVTNPGDTRGIAINNTLHLLVTDAGASVDKAYVVEYQIAGSDPSGNAVPHGVATVFNSGTQAVVGGIQAVALDKLGNMFILNANGTDPFIAELNQTGVPVETPIHLATQCTPTVTQVNSMDLSPADTNGQSAFAYVTSGGTIRKVKLSDGTCTTFADFGSGVTLFGIKDIPPNALPTSPTGCNGNPCPTDETFLVVAKGTIDPSAGETENSETTNDAVDICTNQIDTQGLSCALLLDTGATGPGLTAATWIGNHLYATAGATILDPFLRVRTVLTVGTSGPDEPAWTKTGGTVRDNAVIWTDRGQSKWQASTAYPLSGPSSLLTTYIVDTQNPPHVQKVIEAGTSGPGPTPPAFSNTGGNTLDNAVVWTESHPNWVPNNPYTTGTLILDAAHHVQKVTTAGTSGPGPTQPSFASSPTTDGLVWVNMGQVSTPPSWQPGHLYQVGDTALDQNNNVEQATSAGTSGSSQPNWNGLNQSTIDNAVIWTDQGSPAWVANTAFTLSMYIVDTNFNLETVTTAGTSGPTQPTWPASGTTTDGLVWKDQGTWQANHSYSANDLVGDGAQHLQQVTTAGISGPTTPPFTSDVPATGQTTDGLQWADSGASPSIVARYPVTGQTSLQALALSPLIRNCATADCSSSLPARKVSNSLPLPKVSNFWLADSGSGTFFGLDFETGTPTTFSTTVPSCTLCTGIQSIGIYGAEDAAQPGLTQLPSVSLSTPSNNGTNTTNTATFDFNPNPPASVSNNDDNQLKVTGYNFPSSFSSLALTVYASAIDPASGTSDSLSTPTPNAPISVPPAPCTVATSIFGGNPTGQCVVWQLDNDELPPVVSCATKPSTCPFLWVKLDFFNATVKAAPNFDPNNVIGVLDEQYDATASPDTGFPKVKCQLSQHTVAPQVPVATNCTYVSPLSPSACFTKSRTNIPVKFNCANLPSGKTLADLLPFLHVFQVFSPSGNEASLQPLQGTGGTTNYRLTSGQWNFNLNNPGFGYTPNASRADYQACTKDASGNVEFFCTAFSVKKSCP